MKLFKHFSKRTNIVLAAALALLAVGVPAAVMAGSGPDRPTKVYQEGVAGFDHVTFDSFTNVPGIGNEQQFFNGKYPGTSTYTDPLSEVKNGDDLTLEVYVHNNADSSLNASGAGVAKNTTVQVVLPGTVAKGQQATAYISADNASPKQISDTLDFGAANGGFFGLSYVPGSASLEYKDASGNVTNKPLSDSVVTTGAKIGPNQDGTMEGCFNYVEYVTLHVKVNMPEYTLNKQVRLNGQTSKDWSEVKNVKAGDRAQWSVGFANTGSTVLNSVAILDQVPAGLTVVPGSIQLVNTLFPNGYTFPDSAIMSNGRQISVNIGNYAAGSNAYLYYDTTVDKPAATVCSAETLTNTAYATPQGFGAIYDTASVIVPGNDCTPPVTKTPVYSCDLFHVTLGDRSVKVDTFNTTANNGAAFKDVVINWGDNSSLTTNTPVGQAHNYANYGTYKLTATAHFTVNGSGDVSATSANCAQSVTFVAPTTPPVTPPAVTTPKVLPNTGAGDVVGIFAGAVVIGTLGYRLFLGRKLSRR
ncbi:MAG: hypothetical protein ABI220_05585 [Candidatus Saccharimonadales bacterium]